MKIAKMPHFRENGSYACACMRMHDHVHLRISMGAGMSVLPRARMCYLLPKKVSFKNT